MAQATPRPNPKSAWLERTTPEKVDAGNTSNGKPRRQMTIVLTGGPCAGKSSILAIIRDRLSKRGMQVVTVPEYATHFFGNSDGFQADWSGNDAKEGTLQDILLRFQITQEDMFHEYAGLNAKPSVLLLDRGVMDQKVYAPETVWYPVLKKNNVTEEELLCRYDMIVHLGTCAGNGGYEWGPGSNNPGRYHTPEEAVRLDKAHEEVYRNHKQLRIVPHTGRFEQKVETTLKYLEDALGVDGLAGSRQRVGVSIGSVGIPSETLRTAQAFVMTTTYSDPAKKQHSVRRRQRISVDQWQAGLNGSDSADSFAQEGDASYEERQSIPDECFLARRVISEVAYHAAAKAANSVRIDKFVLSFQTEGGLHYELFYFEGNRSSLILDFPVGASLPHWLNRGLDEEPATSHPGGGPCCMDAKKNKMQRVLRKNSTEEAADEYLRQLVAQTRKDFQSNSAPEM